MPWRSHLGFAAGNYLAEGVVVGFGFGAGPEDWVFGGGFGEVAPAVGEVDEGGGLLIAFEGVGVGVGEVFEGGAEVGAAAAFGFEVDGVARAEVGGAVDCGVAVDDVDLGGHGFIECGLDFGLEHGEYVGVDGAGGVADDDDGWGAFVVKAGEVEAGAEISLVGAGECVVVFDDDAEEVADDFGPGDARGDELADEAFDAVGEVAFECGNRAGLGDGDFPFVFAGGAVCSGGGGTKHTCAW